MESIQSSNSCRNREFCSSINPNVKRPLIKPVFHHEKFHLPFSFFHTKNLKNGKNKYKHDRPTLKHITEIIITMIKIKNHPNILLWFLLSYFFFFFEKSQLVFGRRAPAVGDRHSRRRGGTPRGDLPLPRAPGVRVTWLLATEKLGGGRPGELWWLGGCRHSPGSR